jgi:formate dehydrogenase iron-sulfur subunit
LPLCAEMCSTKALLAGDAPVIVAIHEHRIEQRGYGDKRWGWDMAYGRAENEGADKT